MWNSNLVSAWHQANAQSKSTSQREASENRTFKGAVLGTLPSQHSSCFALHLNHMFEYDPSPQTIWPKHDHGVATDNWLPPPRYRPCGAQEGRPSPIKDTTPLRRPVCVPSINRALPLMCLGCGQARRDHGGILHLRWRPWLRRRVMGLSTLF